MYINIIRLNVSWSKIFLCLRSAVCDARDAWHVTSWHVSWFVTNHSANSLASVSNGNKTARCCRKITLVIWNYPIWNVPEAMITRCWSWGSRGQNNCEIKAAVPPHCCHVGVLWTSDSVYTTAKFIKLTTAQPPVSTLLPITVSKCSLASL